MKKQIKDLIKSAKLVAGANAVALLFAGTVDAKALSEKECKGKYEGKPLSSNIDFPSDYGCECDKIEVNSKTGEVDFIQKNCRVLKPLSDKECQKQFNGKLVVKDGFAGFKGCECETVAIVMDEEMEFEDSIQGNCRAQTKEEKAFLNLVNLQGYDCIGECESDSRVSCMKEKGCQTLVNLECVGVEKPNINNGLSYEEYYRILQKAKKCQAPAKKLIEQTIKSQGR